MTGSPALRHDPPRLAIFISGRGSNMIALVEACRAGRVEAEPALVIANSAKAPGLESAWEMKIAALPLNPRRYPTEADYAADLLHYLRHHEIEFIALAGYLKKLPPAVIAAYPQRILNIHPALLPQYGGSGMYGQNLHAAVLAAGDSESGVTIHLVTEEYDEGPIIAQVRVAVNPDDTPATLAQRILVIEHQLYPKALQALISAAKNNQPLARLAE